MTMTKLEAELALTRLLDKHHAWLVSQPEALLLWTQGRQTRRRVADMLAKEMTTIPTRVINENTPPNRAMRRRILAALEQMEGADWYKDGAAWLLQEGQEDDAPGAEEGPAPAVPADVQGGLREPLHDHGTA